MKFEKKEQIFINNDGHQCEREKKEKNTLYCVSEKLKCQEVS